MNTLNSTIGENMDIQNLISKNISVHHGHTCTVANKWAYA